MTSIDTQGDAPDLDRDNQAARANLACQRCKRRKIKCDRVLPACGTCQKHGGPCSYPLIAEKPGPKPGAPQRRKHGRFFYVNPNVAEANERNDNTDLQVGTTDQLPSSPGNEPQSSLSLNSHGQYTFGLTSILPQHLNRSSGETATSSYDGSNTRQPVLSSGSPSAPDRPGSRGAALANLLHPSHDPLYQLSAAADEVESRDGRSEDLMLRVICKDLNITVDVYRYLLSSYFSNMTTFSLFHKPTFESKLYSIYSPKLRRALLASMFAFSARFKDVAPLQTSTLGRNVDSHIPSSETFLVIADRTIDEALKDCSDEAPQLCLLQAMILTTFHHLTSGVRSLSWRSLGACVTVAYELHLHNIDKDPPESGINPDPLKFCRDEEQRRAWWAIWECDVFASTIRRLPTAIDWSNNNTWLPIDDEVWYTNAYTTSCFLHPDAAVAWKILVKSENKSSKAWFIVVNALMRCAHILSYPQSYSQPRSDSDKLDNTGQQMQANLDVLLSSLYCLTAVLPSDIEYQGEFLSFSAMGTRVSVQSDSNKHGFHIMLQLCRFMIYHHQVFNSTASHLGLPILSHDTNTSTPADKSMLDKTAWNLYLAAADEIIRLIRNCSPKHVPYVNPFLASTIWLVTAAYIIARCLDPPLIKRRVAESNLDLLQINLNSYVSFWGVSATFQKKLSTLEAKLRGLKTQNTEPVRIERGQETQPRPPDELRNNIEFGSGHWPQYNVHRGVLTPPSNSLAPQRGGWNLGNWVAPATFTSPEPDVTGDINSDLWGWCIEELLNYGAVE